MLSLSGSVLNISPCFHLGHNLPIDDNTHVCLPVNLYLISILELLQPIRHLFYIWDTAFSLVWGKITLSILAGQNFLPLGDIFFFGCAIVIDNNEFYFCDSIIFYSLKFKNRGLIVSLCSTSDIRNCSIIWFWLLLDATLWKHFLSFVCMYS